MIKQNEKKKMIIVIKNPSYFKKHFFPNDKSKIFVKKDLSNGFGVIRL